MFRRQLSDDGDVVAAARQRLAALAVHHERGVEQLVESEAAHPPRAAASDAATSDAGQASVTVASQTARHLAERRGELGRWGVTGQHVTVMALCLLLLVILVAWWSLRSVPHAEQVSLTSHRQLPPQAAVTTQPVTVPVSPGQADSAGAGVGGSTTAASRLVVDVAGKVRHPGIVELPAGSRVVDALAAAGGARPGVSLTSLNLARLLVDGEQIVVGIRVPVLAGAPPATGSASGAMTTQPIERVELNTATLEQLDTLPGIGPVTAQAILQWRSDNGPFTAVDELLEVSGIGDATLADIRPYVYV
jgi:competence protein ComEA